MVVHRRVTVFIRLNAALEQTPQMEAKLPIHAARDLNAAPNQRNARLLEKTGKLVIYAMQTFTILSQENKRKTRTFKYYIIFTTDLQ